MLYYKDFYCKEKMLGFVVDSLDSVLKEVNEHIAKEHLDVINIETILDVSGINVTDTKEKGIRIWYKI